MNYQQGSQQVFYLMPVHFSRALSSNSEQFRHCYLLSLYALPRNPLSLMHYPAQAPFEGDDAHHAFIRMFKTSQLFGISGVAFVRKLDTT